MSERSPPRRSVRTRRNHGGRIVSGTHLQQAGFARAPELLQLRDFLQRARFVAVTGVAGIGKTTLVKQLALSHNEDFPGGIRFIEWDSVGHSGSIDALVEDSHRTTSGRTLFVIDGINEYVEHIGADLVRVARALAAEARVLVTSRTAVPAADLTLRLGVLSENASEELLAAYGLRGQDAAIFAKAFGGHPLAIELAASAVREGLFRPKELLAHLHEFHAPGIVGPGGIRVDADGPVPALQLQITDINEQLLRSLDTDITLARTLSPRKFEELVADLLVRLGYKVELTPAFRDGGKDIYAATRDDLGSFLYLVECKKYALANPVGVEVVRSLYGTVQAEQATAGILVTTSVFTKGARDFQRRVQNHLSLRDYAELHRWIRRVLRAGGADSAI